MAPLQLQYTPPQPPEKHGEPNPSYEAVVKLYVEGPMSFDVPTLEAGMKQFLFSWTYARWPKLGELRAFMVEAERQVRQPRTPPERHVEHQAPPPLSGLDRRRMQFKLAKLQRLMASGDIATMSVDEGRRACEEYAREQLAKEPAPTEQEIPF